MAGNPALGEAGPGAPAFLQQGRDARRVDGHSDTALRIAPLRYGSVGMNRSSHQRFAGVLAQGIA